MALTREGRWLGVADERGNLGLLENETGQVQSTVTQGGNLFPHDLMFSADERQLVVLNWKIGFYDLKDGRVFGKPRQLECGEGSYLTTYFAQSPDNRWLVANAKKVRIYDLEKMEEWGKEQSRPSPDYYGGSVLFSPDGKELIFGYDWKKNAVLRWRFLEEAYPWSEPVYHDDAPALALSPQGLWATGMPKAKGGRIHGIKMGPWGADGWLLEFRGHRFPVTALAFSTDGRYLASGDMAGEILIWDTQTQPEQLGVPPGEF